MDVTVERIGWKQVPNVKDVPHRCYHSAALIFVRQVAGDRTLLHFNRGDAQSRHVWNMGDRERDVPRAPGVPLELLGRNA